MDEAALQLHKTNPAEAVSFITDFCLNNARTVVDAWWKLGAYLLVKYNHLRIYDPETRRAGRIQTPDWWNRAVIEQDKLEPVSRSEPKPEVKREKREGN
jgi:hypothetical protein